MADVHRPADAEAPWIGVVGDLDPKPGLGSKGSIYHEGQGYALRLVCVGLRLLVEGLTLGFKVELRTGLEAELEFMDQGAKSETCKRKYILSQAIEASSVLNRFLPSMLQHLR